MENHYAEAPVRDLRVNIMLFPRCPLCFFRIVSRVQKLSGMGFLQPIPA
ncbi:MAG: hypothetical protein K5841_04745 [Fretibacterium sp.]|nr:hypothetical protein [Fretibacterium sp.]